MSRGLHSDLKTELATDHLDQIYLIQLSIGGSTFFRTTAYFDVVFDSNTYSASGDVLQVPSITETNTLSTAQVDLVLTGVDQSFISLFLNRLFLLICFDKTLTGNDLFLLNLPFDITKLSNLLSLFL